MPWLHSLCRSALAVAVLTTALRGHLCRRNCINRNHSIIANLWCKHGFSWVKKPLLPVVIFFIRFFLVFGTWYYHMMYDVCIWEKGQFLQNIRVTGWLNVGIELGAVSFNFDRRSCDYRRRAPNGWIGRLGRLNVTTSLVFEYPNFQPHMGVYFTFGVMPY